MPIIINPATEWGATKNSLKLVYYFEVEDAYGDGMMPENATQYFNIKTSSAYYRGIARQELAYRFRDNEQFKELEKTFFDRSFQQIADFFNACPALFCKIAKLEYNPQANNPNFFTFKAPEFYLEPQPLFDLAKALFDFDNPAKPEESNEIENYMDLLANERVVKTVEKVCKGVITLPVNPNMPYKIDYAEFLMWLRNKGFFEEFANENHNHDDMLVAVKQAAESFITYGEEF